LEFQDALAEIAANGSGSNSIEYTGPSATLTVDTNIALPGRNDDLQVTINSAELAIGSAADGTLTVGRNSSLNIVGDTDILVGHEYGGTLIIDGGTVNVFGGASASCMCVSYYDGAGDLLIRNGGVLNMGTGEGAAYSQFFAGYGGPAAITLDNGQINFGDNGASIRIGMGNSVTMNLTNGSVIDSSRGASHLWIGEWENNLVTVNVENSSIIILGGDTNTPKDERAFVIGYAGGSGVLNQSGDDSHVHVAGIYRIGIAAGNDSSGTYNLNGGLLEIGTAAMRDAFRIGVNVYDTKNAGTAIFNVNGGTAKLHGDLLIADSGSAGYRPDSTVNINGGKVSVGGKVHFGAGTGKMNLNGGGVLELSGADAITGTGALTFNGGTIRATSDLGISHAASLTAAGATFDSNDYDITYSGVLSGVGGVTKEGSGTLVLTGANTFAGGVTVLGGVLETGHVSALGATGEPVTLDGGTLKLTTLVDLFDGISAGAGNGVVDMAGHNVTLSSASTGAGGVTFNNGNLTLDGLLGWFGVTGLGEGVTLTTTGADQLSANSTLQLAGTATLANGALAQSLGGLAGGGSVVTGGLLTIGGNNTSTQFDGVISGAGGLRKVGSGTLTLTKAQTYTGGTIVEAGTLALSGNGAFVAGANLQLLGGFLDLGGTTLNSSQLLLQGGSVINGTVNLTGDFTVQSGTLGSALTGSGDLIKTGTGSLTLGEDAEDFAGAIIVEEGELRGPIAAFTTSGGIQNNGLITFVESGPVVWNGAITGTGDLALTGGGAFEIAGDGNTYSGRTLVQSGTLRVNGSLANSVVHVLGDGTLGGTGTVRGIVANGAVAPGNSIGTLNVEGDVLLDASSTYQVEVDASGASDRIAATGAARLNGGNLQILAEAGDYKRTTEYTVLTAAGGVTGSFRTVSSNFAFLTPTLSYGANEVGLLLDRNDIDFGDVASTPNGRAAAIAVEQLGYGHEVYNAVLYATDDEAQAGFAMLAGEVHASVRSALVEDGRHVREAIGDRITQSSGKQGVEVWTAAFSNWGKHDGVAGVVGTDRDTQGVLLGLDAAVGRSARIGILGGYSGGDLSSTRGSADIETMHVGAYGGFRLGGVGVQVGAAHSWHQIDTTRTVDFSGFRNVLAADYDGGSSQVFADVSYDFAVGAAAITPFANIAHVHLSTESFDEQGGAAALSSHREKSNVAFSTLGARFAAANLFGKPGVAVRGSAGWRRTLNDDLPLAELAFDGSSPFMVDGAPLSKNAAVLGLGIDVAVSENVVLGLGYSGQIGNNGSDHGVKAGLTIGF